MKQLQITIGNFIYLLALALKFEKIIIALFNLT